MTERKFSTVCPVCRDYMKKVNNRMYECQCGNWMYVQEDFIEYRSDIEAPADFYPKSNDYYPGYCRDCNGHYPKCKKNCLELE